MLFCTFKVIPKPHKHGEKLENKQNIGSFQILSNKNTVIILKYILLWTAPCKNNPYKYDFTRAAVAVPVQKNRPCCEAH